MDRAIEAAFRLGFGNALAEVDGDLHPFGHGRRRRCCAVCSVLANATAKFQDGRYPWAAPPTVETLEAVQKHKEAWTMIDPVSETAKCQMDCCKSLAEWYAYVAALNVDAVRAGYGLRKPTPYRTRDPVVEYGLSLGKVVFRVERGGVAVYSPLSAREYANYHGLEIRFAKCQMVVTQLADMKRWDLTNDEMAEVLQSSGLLDGLDDLDALSPERPAE